MSLTLINPFVFSAPPGGGVTLGGPAVHHDSGWATASLSNHVGWKFTVGSADIDVAALRYYHPAGSTETVRLFRWSDGALLASASVTSAGGWGETEITPVTLSAGQAYVISTYTGASRTVYRNPSTYKLDPAVTFDTGVFGSDANMPSSSSAQAYVNAAFRTTAPASGYRFYRIAITANNGRSTTNIAEVEFRASVGGDDETGAGVAFATTAFGREGGDVRYEADKAFDNAAGTYWSTTTSGVTSSALAYDFGTGAEIQVAQYTIQARSDAANGAPKDWTLEGSNDLDTWDTLDTVTGETGWSNGETRTFTV